MGMLLVALFPLPVESRQTLTRWGLRSNMPLCFASSSSRRGRRRPSSSTKEEGSSSSDGEGFEVMKTATPSTSSTTSNNNKKMSPTNPSASSASSSSSTGAKQIYSMPALYDLAFGYRDYEEEVNFLLNRHREVDGDGKNPKRTLELAAGPARHSVYALKASLVEKATALDNSPEMVQYGESIASEELADDGDDDDGDVSKLDKFVYLMGDMTDFEISSSSGEDELYDSAWILLGSLQHLTTNEQVISCFENVNKVLNKDGTLILELPHPRETFSMVECTRNGWEVPLEDENGQQSGELKIIWGDDDDTFDPITQVRQFTVSLELHDYDGDSLDDDSSQTSSNKLQSVREVVPLRLFTSQEINAFAYIAGFKVTSIHGALMDDVSIDDEDEAFRLVCVLQKL